ncbi:MAG: NAD(P)-dependent oxidoreductase, partial [Bdellovibrionota bacterium]
MKNKPVVVLNYPFDPRVIAIELAPFAKVIIASRPEKLRKALRGADAFVSLLSTPVNAALLSDAPKLKVVSNFAVGIDNIDFKACKERGIRVCNTPRVLTRSTAELTLTLLLAVARRVPEGELLCRKGNFLGWAPDLLLGLELKGRRAVIVGKGRIGSEVARLFRGLGLKIDFITRSDSPSAVHSKLKSAQVLSLHIPYKKENYHWLNSKRISHLPRDAIVLNTARGPLIDEKALIRALKNRNIFGAGLDVFEREPRIPTALRKLKNVVLLPHLGSAT